MEILPRNAQALAADGVATLLAPPEHGRGASYEQAVAVFRAAFDLVQAQSNNFTGPFDKQKRKALMDPSSDNADEDEEILQERMEEVMQIKSKVHTVELPATAGTIVGFADDHNPCVVYRRSLHITGREPKSPEEGQNDSLLDSVETALLFYNMGLTFHLCAVAPTTRPSLGQRDANLRSALKSYQAAINILRAADVKHEEELKTFHLLWVMEGIDNCAKENASIGDDVANNVQHFWQIYFLLQLALGNNVAHIHSHFMDWNDAKHCAQQTTESINEGAIDGLFQDLLHKAESANKDFTAREMLVEDEAIVDNQSVVTTVQRDLLKLWSRLELQKLELQIAPAA